MIMFRQLRPEIERIARTFTLLNPDGLQARSATEFVSCVLLFKSTAMIHVRGKQYPADRILEVLLAGLNGGDTFVLEVEGPDARRAVERIARLPMFLREDANQATQNSRSHHREALD
jgi:phosphotransferase system HPr (HPr) family protein